MLLCDEDRMARHGAGMLNPVVEAEVDADAEVEAETEVESDVETMTEVEAEADIATHLDVSLDASDLFDDFDDFDVETPFLGVFEEARLNDAEAEVAEAETKTIQDFGWF